MERKEKRKKGINEKSPSLTFDFQRYLEELWLSERKETIEEWESLGP